MVFFCCNSCGGSLKKNAVDKHFMQCRSTSISCMDCHKDFKGNEYQAHTKCISEQEKYGGLGYQAPANQNKGEKKQMAWFETVQATLKKAGQSLRPAAKNLLQHLTKHENVPRKKPKFFNFVANVSKNRFDQDTVVLVWDLLESQWKSENEAQTVKPAQAGHKKEDGSSGATSVDVSSADANDESSSKEKKKKKKKDKKGGKEDGEELLEADSSTMVVEESVSSEKKKKKRKREEGEDSTPVEAETEVVSEVTEEPPKKKKKKKNKNKDGEAEETNGHANGHTNGHGTFDTNGNGMLADDGELVIALNEEEDGSKKSKKKKKKNKEKDEESSEKGGKYALLQQSMTEDENSSMVVEDEISISKKKKKNKKNKHELLA